MLLAKPAMRTSINLHKFLRAFLPGTPDPMLRRTVPSLRRYPPFTQYFSDSFPAYPDAFLFMQLLAQMRVVESPIPLSRQTNDPLVHLFADLVGWRTTSVPMHQTGRPLFTKHPHQHLRLPVTHLQTSGNLFQTESTVHPFL